MKIKHRIGITIDKYQRKILIEIGLIERNNQEEFFVFELFDDDVKYQSFKKYINEWNLPDLIETEFTTSELNSASLLVYNYTWSNGYPQPEDDFGYIGTTYKKEGYCKSCGTGLVQQEPFRIKKEPVWGNKKLFDLNWVFDEIFVSKEAYETIFKGFGIGCREVRLFKKETAIQNTVQLEIPTTSIEINLENQTYEICNACGIKKYSPQIKGFFPKLSAPVTELHCFKSVEYFGSGANAHKKIFMSQELRQAMLKNKIKSQFMPVKN